MNSSSSIINMIIFRNFYIDESKKDEIETALDECIEHPLHPKLVSKSVVSAKDYSVKDLTRFLIQSSTTDFSIDEDVNKLFYQRKIRFYFIKYMQFKVREFINETSSDEKTLRLSELYSMILLYRPMITNFEYGFSSWFKTFIEQTIEFVTQGLLISFLFLCEFCPDFVTDDCYPKFNCVASHYVKQIATTDVSFINLFVKHQSKCEKYIVPQLLNL
jgi:hypothetical protein